MERNLHFPHTRVMLDGESRCWETARKYLDDFQSRLEEDSWHSTELLSVDTEIISKKKCHTRISFKRLRRNGSIINTYHSLYVICLLYTSPSPRDRTRSRMPSSA